MEHFFHDLYESITVSALYKEKSSILNFLLGVARENYISI